MEPLFKGEGLKNWKSPPRTEKLLTVILRFFKDTQQVKSGVKRRTHETKETITTLHSYCADYIYLRGSSEGQSLIKFALQMQLSIRSVPHIQLVGLWT